MKNIFQIIPIFTFVIFLIGIGHFVIYKSFLIIFNITIPKWINFTRAFFIIGSLSFVSMMILTQIWYSKILSFLYEISAIWLGTVYFLFLASIIFLIFYGLASIIHIPYITIKITGIILLLAGLGFSVYGVINSYDLKISEYIVKINNLPDEWDNKKIVMFSDTHFGNIRNIDFGEKLVRKINEQKPDLVLIAGDYYDGPHVNDLEIANIMMNVNSQKGIIFASGNHEEYGNNQKFIDLLKDAGVIVLSNENIIIDGIQIVGVDYKTGTDEESLLSILDDMNLYKDLPRILIKHVPNNLSITSSKNFDVVVSGHVHKGQVWPGPWITEKIFKKFAYGLNYFDKTAVITTSGSGTWGPPQRVGTNSEIVVIHLKR